MAGIGILEGSNRMIDDNGDDGKVIIGGDADYLRQRALRERYMARHARCGKARAAHQRLAGFYADRHHAIAGVSPMPDTPWRAIWSRLRRLWD
jgi:hypothetical protein